MILAPLRGVTIRSFREVFSDVIREAGFTEALTPFIPANRDYDPLKDRELRSRESEAGNRASGLKVTPQFIGKDPSALRACLERVKAAGYETADLNCGCPFPMVRNKGRGSGLLRTPDVFRQMMEVGCEVMGPNRFSVKARLGVDRNDELLKLMPLVNLFPLRFLTVHARTARQMYDGAVDDWGLGEILKVAKVPVVVNGDIPFPPPETLPNLPNLPNRPLMLGRSFVRALGRRDDIVPRLLCYIDVSQTELSGDLPVLGRMKELIAYWKDLPRWRRLWSVVKISRSVDELRTILS